MQPESIIDRARRTVVAPEERVLNYLSGGPATVAEIVADLRMTPRAVNGALARLYSNNLLFRRGEIVARASIWQTLDGSRSLAVVFCNPDPEGAWHSFSTEPGAA